jgi:hypothetical protein
MVLRGCWCHIIVLNAQASTDNKIYDSEDSFCEELGQALDLFGKYQIEIGDCNEKLGREDVLKPTNLNEFTLGY